MKKKNSSFNGFPASITEQVLVSEIAGDALQGLTSNPKYLLPKYFYDEAGSAIFRQIMKIPEYYLTSCELEIFTEYRDEIAAALIKGTSGFSIVELGSGNGIKTRILLKALSGSGQFRYVPVDISRKSNDGIRESLENEFPSILVEPLTGDYSQVLSIIDHDPDQRQIILFLGSNIGNLDNSDLSQFLGNLSAFTSKGDKVLIGFDLKKSPAVIMKAYSDPHGLTRNFNLNHLIRLNRELNADFDIGLFEHHTEYNPVSGEVKSYLVSKVEQTVYAAAIGESFTFVQWEPVFMELSRKFNLWDIEELASIHHFRVERNFTDYRNYFADSLWTRV